LQSSLSKSPFGALACTKGILENTLINTVDYLQKERKIRKQNILNQSQSWKGKNPKGQVFNAERPVVNRILCFHSKECSKGANGLMPHSKRGNKLKE